MIPSILMDILTPIAVDSTQYLIEVVEPDFYGLPKYIWDSVFATIEVLVVGLLLALIASKYQHRKEVEWRLRGDLLKKRIESYQKVSTLIYSLANQTEASEEEMEKMSDLLDYSQFICLTDRYAEIFVSESNYNQFRENLDNLIAQEKLFLDYRTLLHLEKMRLYFDEMDGMIKHFIRGENNSSGNFTGEKNIENIEFGLKSLGMALNNDMSKWYGLTDRMLADKILHLELKPQRNSFYILWDKLTDRLLDWVQKENKNSIWVKICISLKIGKWDFICKGENVFLLFMGAHYMVRGIRIWEETDKNAKKMMEEYYDIYC